MINIKEATHLVLNQTLSFGEESVALKQAIGRILREDLHAERDFPPFDRVTMDGIAISFSTFEKGQKSFPIQNVQAAGAPQATLENETHCMEVMTGAMLPQNCDTVIRYEDLEIQNGTATIQVDTLKLQQNVHHRGTDRKADSLIVKAGGIISPAEIGVAATIGKSELLVAAIPKVVIITTGDELVEVDEQPLPYQIRSSNVYKIKSALQQWGLPAVALHLIDDKAAIKSSLEECLQKYEVIILSGGVSKGKFDFVPEVLADLGVDKHFHKVAQRPGKPFWFGGTATCRVFALPGNPVSSFMCLQRYFRPWFRACMQLDPMPHPFAILSEDFTFKPDLTYFLQVKISYDADGRIMAKPVTGNGSGDLANLVDADAFLELPQGRNTFNKGEAFPLIIYR